MGIPCVAQAGIGFAATLQRTNNFVRFILHLEAIACQANPCINPKSFSSLGPEWMPACRRKGLIWANLFLTGEDNADTWPIAHRLRAKVYKRYRFYEKEA
jgi:hypothetical protein